MKKATYRPILTLHKLHENGNISTFDYSTIEWNYIFNFLLPRKLQSQNFICAIPTLKLNG